MQSDGAASGDAHTVSGDAGSLARACFAGGGCCRAMSRALRRSGGIGRKGGGYGFGNSS